MYRIGICDDDKILCSALEEQIYELSKELAIKIEIDVWYSGESIENDLKKGIELDLLFLDIELVQNNGIAVEILFAMNWRICRLTLYIFLPKKVMPCSYLKCSRWTF